MEMLGKNKDYHKDTCENCNYKFNCYGFVGGQAICKRCYPTWFENIKLKEENENLCEKIDIYKDAIGDYPLKDLEECIRKDLSDFSYKEENEKLKKENEELKSNVDELEYQYECLVNGNEGY